MELDRAFRLAVIRAWDDLSNIAKPCSVRIEYEKEPGASVKHLRVWADRPKSYQFLVCNFRATATSAHLSGARFANGYRSDQLARSLDFITSNQDQFTRRGDAGLSGLVLIYPPTDEDRAEAAAWTSAIGSDSAQPAAMRR